MNGRNRRRAAAATAIAVLALALAPASGSALPSRFFGMLTYEDASPAELQQMRQSGVGTIRIPINWEAIEPTRGAARDWTRHDILIGNAASAGLTVMPHLFGVPPWLHPQPPHPPIYEPSEIAAWQALLTDLARRYGTNGTFWALYPELPRLPATHWEIWNEVNIGAWWDGAPNPRDYAKMLRLSRTALEAGDPGAQVVTAGLFPRPLAIYGPTMEKFLDRMYRVKGVKQDFDVLGVHPYARQPKGVVDAVADARRVMGKHKDKAPIWVSELGWSTSGVGHDNAFVGVNESRQAKLLTGSFKALIKERKELKLRRIFWHTWRDYEGPGGETWIYRMGLLRSNGAPKPAFSAFRRIAK